MSTAKLASSSLITSRTSRGSTIAPAGALALGLLSLVSTAHAEGLSNFPNDMVAWTLADCQGGSCEVHPDYSHEVLSVAYVEVGIYDVLFDLTADRGPYNYQVTPVSEVEAYCKTSIRYVEDGYAGVRVRCYDPAGDPVDTRFSAFGQYHAIFSVPPNQDGFLGYTANDLNDIEPDYNSMQDHIDASWNPFAGTSAVYMLGHSSGQGAALVTAKGDDPYRCFPETVKGYTEGTVMTVRCVDPSGQSVAALFDVTYMHDLLPAYDDVSAVSPAYLAGAYVVLDPEQRYDDYVVPSQRYNNVLPGSSVIERSGEGTYTVALFGLDSQNATIQVSSLGDAWAQCRVADLPSPSGIGFTVDVICRDSDGDPLDAGFALMYQTHNSIYE